MLSQRFPRGPFLERVKQFEYDKLFQPSHFHSRENLEKNFKREKVSKAPKSAEKFSHKDDERREGNSKIMIIEFGARMEVTFMFNPFFHALQVGWHFAINLNSAARF
jgi:hypothetical protein